MSEMKKLTVNGVSYDIVDEQARASAAAAIPYAEKGAINGVAVLDENGKLVSTQLPTLGTLAAKNNVAESDLDTTLKNKINSMNTNINTINTNLTNKISVLEGSDVNKSIRAIANEELTLQLIPEVAKGSLDTLQEIAAWIQEHPDDAAEMNQAITDLQNQLNNMTSGGSVKDYIDGADATTLDQAKLYTEEYCLSEIEKALANLARAEEVAW